MASRKKGRFKRKLLERQRLNAEFHPDMRHPDRMAVGKKRYPEKVYQLRLAGSAAYPDEEY